MREIKFRAWTKEMSYLFPVANIDFDRKSLEEIRGRGIDGRPLYRIHSFKDIILEQYTGIKDKNGKEIYEGDIFDLSGWIVSYCGDEFEGLGMNVGFYLQRDDFASWMELESREDYDIIGNIHETK